MMRVPAIWMQACRDVSRLQGRVDAISRYREDSRTARRQARRAHSILRHGRDR